MFSNQCNHFDIDSSIDNCLFGEFFTIIKLLLPFTNYIFIIFTEIARVRASLFQINGVKKEPLTLPEPEGAMVTLNEKVYVPVREHPDVST